MSVGSSEKKRYVSGEKTGKERVQLGGSTVGKKELGGGKAGRGHLWLLPSLQKMFSITRSRKMITKEWKYQFRKKIGVDYDH